MNFIQSTKNWINNFVVRLNLCPFASTPMKKELVRFVLYEGKDLPEFLSVIEKELKYLQKIPPKEVETTFIIHPNFLNDFYDFNDFLYITDQLIFNLQLEGIIQIASFHPHYQFEGTKKEAVTNYTNRSPFPMLHLLREDSLSKAIDNYPEIEEVPTRNMNLLKRLGIEKVGKLLKESKKT